MGCSKSKAAVKTEEVENTTAQPERPVITEASAEERALIQLKLIFDSIDANADGTVDKVEFGAALDKDENLGALIKEAGFTNSQQGALEQLDANKDGKVSWEEFQTALKEKAKEEVKETGGLAAADLPAAERVLKQLKAIYDGVDANADGSVSKEELSAKLKDDKNEHGLMKDGTFAELMTEAGYDPQFRAFDQLDTDKDGKITWEEFKAQLTQAADTAVKQTGDVIPAEAQVEELKDEPPANAPMCGCW